MLSESEPTFETMPEVSIARKKRPRNSVVDMDGDDVDNASTTATVGGGHKKRKDCKVRHGRGDVDAKKKKRKRKAQDDVQKASKKQKQSESDDLAVIARRMFHVL